MSGFGASGFKVKKEAFMRHGWQSRRFKVHTMGKRARQRRIGAFWITGLLIILFFMSLMSECKVANALVEQSFRAMHTPSESLEHPLPFSPPPLP